MYSNHFYEEATLIFGSCCQLAKEPNGDSVTIIIKDQTACQEVPKIYIQSISRCVKTYKKKALRDLSSFFPRIWNGLDNLPNWANCPVLGISTIFCSIILVRGFNVSWLLQWSMERTILPDNEMTHWFMNALAKNQHWINTFDAEFFFLELRPGISSVLQT